MVKDAGNKAQAKGCLQYAQRERATMKKRKKTHHRKKEETPLFYLK